MLTTYAAVKLLGESFGIESHYWDNYGKLHRTPHETAAKILEAKGISISAAHLALDPSVLVVASNQFPESLSLYFPYAATEEPAASEGVVRLHERTGRFPQTEYALSDQRVRIAPDEQTGLLQVTLPFPPGIGEGPYTIAAELIVEGQTFLRQCLWLVCPPHAFAPTEIGRENRMAGIGIALYGVRSGSNWGVGDFGDLKFIVDWAKDDLGVDFIGLNPLHALFNRRPYNHSPYTPSSRLYRNFIYLDVPAIPEFASATRARSLVESTDFQLHINNFREKDHVEYEDVAAIKISVLREVFQCFLDQHGTDRTSDRWAGFQSYRESEGEYLERFATFCALQEHFQNEIPQAKNWRDWPTRFGDPTSQEVKDFRHEHEKQVLFWMYIQWQIDQQLGAVQEYAQQRGMRIGLYCDEALGVDRNGADFWAWQEFFHEGFSVGAPPDQFAPDGQDWGFPPPNSERIRDAGYQWFLKTLEANCRHCGALRIDHVMQLSHLFWIPAGRKASAGVYVKDNEADLLNLLALVSRRSRTIVVGEDLGTVPHDFRERLMNKGLLSYRLFYFERSMDQRQLPADAYPEAALVSIATHDLPTLAGFWAGRDIEVRQEIGDLESERAEAFRVERAQHKERIIERLVEDGHLKPDEGETALQSALPTDALHTAVLAFLLRTRCHLVMINQEDVFLDGRQQNFPGTTWQHPNWVTKMKYSIEELTRDPEALRLAGKVKKLVEEAGRSA